MALTGTQTRVYSLIVLLFVAGGSCKQADSQTDRDTEDNERKNSLYDIDVAIHDKPSDDVVDGDPHQKGDDGDDAIFLMPRAAKSFLRVRRWGIKSLWGEEQEEESESRERNNEHNRRVQATNACKSSCWGQWSPYSSCSVRCGSSGVQRSTRSAVITSHCSRYISSCPGSTVRTQNCGRSCNNGGTLRPNNCACPPGYTGTCCENRVTCGFPGKPSNGAVSPAGSRHNYGTVARFSCSAGYTLKGAIERTCQQNGQWSNSVPTCLVNSCGDPGSPSHGTRQGTDFRFGASVVFSCNSGYVLNGDRTITCGADGSWSNGKPTCQAVECPALAAVPGGSVSAPARVYNSVATYSCSSGHYMVGSPSRTCGANGQWTGSQPTCTRITCSALPSPDHGKVTPASDSPMSFGSSVQFSCNSGYRLQGSASRTCGGSSRGTWSGSQPTCQPVDCGNPGVPANGAKQGGVYTFGNKVTFQCQPGYKQSGSVEVQCLATGRWNGSLPQCTACPVNTYKIGLNSLTECSPCPSHSHTVSQASVGKQLCVCDAGYRGPAGGPCSEIFCPSLTAPPNGRIKSCERKVNNHCNMTCVNGHVKSSGSESRKCLPDGTWSGSDFACRACPQSTYKSSLSECSPCPVYSSTVSTGNELQGCVCNAGFQGPPGGPCTDQDECQNTNATQCSQTCVNTPGSYRCTCTLPGFIQDEVNPKLCIAKNNCPDLEPPGNGGTVCVGEITTNTERCEIKCNPGYEHPLRVNEFEECGPSTNWRWSHEIDEIPRLDCVESYFAGVSLEAEVAYFIADCSSLTEAMKAEIAASFVSRLQSKGVCANSGTSSCNVQDVSFDCGALVNDEFNFGDLRKKRSVQQTQAELKVKFKIGVPEVPMHVTNCTVYCNNVVLNEQCVDYCVKQHKFASERLLSQTTERLEEIFNTVHTEQAQEQVTTSTPPTTPGAPPGEDGYIYHEVPTRFLYHDVNAQRSYVPYEGVLEDNELTLRLGRLILVPMNGITHKIPRTQCGQGMIKSKVGDKCVPCPAGTFLPPDANVCQLCPEGTHQPRTKQTSCIPCNGSRQSRRGSSSCDQTTGGNTGGNGGFVYWHPNLGVRDNPFGLD